MSVTCYSIIGSLQRIVSTGYSRLLTDLSFLTPHPTLEKAPAPVSVVTICRYFNDLDTRPNRSILPTGRITRQSAYAPKIR